METGFGVIASEVRTAATMVTEAEPEIEPTAAVTLVVPAELEVRRPFVPGELLTVA
jgi:hypothetical protein